MKKAFFLLFAVLFFPLRGMDYHERGNWIIFGEGGGKETLFDVFYVYPTLFRSETFPLMMQSDPALMKKTFLFSRAQTAVFRGKARIFAPFVRQLEYDRALRDLTVNADPEKSGMQTGIADTREAFLYYLKHCNMGRPFILFGHSQGAIDLYLLLKNTPEISPRKGFVAAYLPGLPRVTAEKFENDFAGRDVRIVSGARDVGVVAVWNTQSPSAECALFSGENVLCVNPLNWRTDEKAAAATENLGAVFYDYRTDKTVRKANFCGARIELKKGALIVDLPPRSRYDANGTPDAGVFHVNDVSFFAENIAQNAEERVKAWSSSRDR